MKLTDKKYTRIDKAALTKEFNELLESFSNSENPEKEIEILHKINALRNTFSNTANLASIRHSINTKDAFYNDEKDFYDEFYPEYQSLEFRLNKLLLKTKNRISLEEKFGKHLFDIAETSVKCFSDKIIPLLQEENRLSTQYDKLLSGAEIEFQGKTLNLSQMTPYEMDKDRKVRKAASEAKYKFFEKNKKELDTFYDKLVKTRHKIALDLGFKNFTEVGYLRMGRTDYGPKEVAAFRKEVLDKVVPLSKWLKDKQRKRLELDKLYFYDESIHFLSGNPKPKGDPEWILKQADKMYQELSTETSEFFNFMVENDLMDVLTKDGKSPGGYCNYLPDFKFPFIFANFNGTSGDIDVMTHEAGHAFQCYESRHFDIPEYYFPTAEAAEIHSMSMEYFTWPYMDLFFEDEVLKYKFLHLEQSFNFLPYGVAVDEFQHLVYENPDATPEERNQFWKQMEEKYLPGRNYDNIPFLENGGFWQKQKHIYQVPFYYIDYTLAGVCALQFWVKDSKNHEKAWADYLDLCKRGGSLPFLKLVETAGLKSPFKEGSLAEVSEKAEKWLESVNDSEL
ncbi:MAG: M3 family oligoendopeptidase [Chitinophagaceae bacterium]|nr:MAG: M3 family oligoendopeptidase [Chitinophagaceae bacterium]